MLARDWLVGRLKVAISRPTCKKRVPTVLLAGAKTFHEHQVSRRKILIDNRWRARSHSVKASRS